MSDIDKYCELSSPYFDLERCLAAQQSSSSSLMTWLVWIVVAVVLLVLAIKAFYIIDQYERGVVYRLGRVKRERQPGFNVVIPFVDRLVKIMTAVEAMTLEPQQVITKDNVSLSIRAVVYFRVIDAVKAEVEVDDYKDAIYQRAQSVLRQVIGASELNSVLAQTEDVSGQIKSRLADSARNWGLEVDNVELTDIELPDGMRRAMAAQAEAVREAAAKVAAAEGEQSSAQILRRAADVLSPVALRLRELQTIAAIGTEQNTVIVVDSQQGAPAAYAAAGQVAGRQTGI
jgi:regulator of protease activity HflC (stomatin/prohibitin superfamily)